MPRSIFYHIPKTGGTWVRRAIEAAGIPAAEVGDSPHCAFTSTNGSGLFKFAFVRHPLTWYQSFWCYRMRLGWRMEDTLDPCMSRNFETFVDNVIQRIPNHLVWRYEKYVGPDPGVLDFVGKQENLQQDLIRALRMAGEKFDEDKILAVPRLNASSTHPEYADNLREKVLNSEAEVISRFGYDAPLTKTTKEFFSGPWLPGATALGTSMLPFFKSRDEIWHEPANPASIRTGDLITFYTRFGSLTTHRMVKVLRQNGGLSFLTKGDNRLDADVPVFPDQVVGRVVKAGSHNLAKVSWRLLGNVIALISYFQWLLYVCLKDGHLNRFRHTLERRGQLPKIRLRETFKLATNPFALIAAGMKKTSVRKDGMTEADKDKMFLKKKEV